MLLIVQQCFHFSFILLGKINKTTNMRIKKKKFFLRLREIVKTFAPRTKVGNRFYSLKTFLTSFYGRAEKRSSLKREA